MLHNLLSDFFFDGGRSHTHTRGIIAHGTWIDEYPISLFVPSLCERALHLPLSANRAASARLPHMLVCTAVSKESGPM